MGKILIVDDDKNMLNVLTYNLVKEGYQVVVAESGPNALEMAKDERPDLIILDIMLPGLDGFGVCRILRKEMSTPVLMLTARVEEVDKVVGLEMGADDYMTKPFSMRELLARVRALLRRARYPEAASFSKQEPSQPIVTAGNIEIDMRGHRVSRNGLFINLSPKEFDLLAFLITHRGLVFNRVGLVEKLWGYDYQGTARTVDVHIRSIRKKIEDNPDKPEHLLTVHGFGYKFVD